MKDSKGKFIRTNTKWSPENTESGYIDSAGRFRVYYPDHPRAYSDGYLMRSIIHYEYYNSCIIPEGYDVHHINHIRTDDSKDNLILLSHKEHSHLHNPKKWKESKCVYCGIKFKRKPSRFNRPQRPGKYCSLQCYHEWRRKNAKK